MCVSGILIVMVDHCKTTFSQSNEYTADREYYKQLEGLTDVPTDIPKDALEVYLGHNNINKPKANAFSGLSECTLLSLQDNLMTDLEQGAFNGLGNVTLLELALNRLSTLKVGMFQGLVVLEDLNLSSNRIGSIENNTFVNLMRLENLDLGSNRLGSLDPGMFCGLKCIEKLNLAGNYLTSLPEDVFKHLPRPLDLGIQDTFVSRPPFLCDAALCWLKEEEMNGTISWLYTPPPRPPPTSPRCANRMNWDTLNCNETGDDSSIHFY